jgi:uncharacterized membrane-anchored protein
MVSRSRLIAAVVAAGWLAGARAADPEAPTAAAAPPELHYQTGDVALPNRLATLHLDSEYRYLDPKETAKLLVAWGNPPDAVTDTQGAVVPAAMDPFTRNGWAVVLSYVDDGHVDDSDARKIDYQALMEDMKKSTREANEERAKAGYASVNLVGWATQPSYDSTTHKMYWAKDLAFGDGEHTLNYDVRVLGREGVLSMNAVASMGQLASIRDNMQSLIKQADFNPGQRYEDYNKSSDRLAAYGIGALVAGGAAAKMGLFAKLFAVIIAFKKVAIAGVVAAGGFLAKLFKGRSKDQPAT